MDEGTDLKNFMEQAGIREPERTQYIERLHSENINLDVLADFSGNELKDLGIKAGDVKRIIKHLKKNRHEATAAEKKEDSSTGSKFDKRHECLEKELRDLKKEFLKYRLTADFLFIGEAASELLDTDKKPKLCSSPLLENNITYNSTPKKKPLKPLSTELKYTCEMLAEGRNVISHNMKRKRADPEFLEITLDDYRDVKRQMMEVGEDSPSEIPLQITEIFDNKSRTKDF